MRKLAVASVILLVSVGVVLAEEFSANISKVEGNKVTFHKTKKGQKEGDAMTLTAADNVKVNKGKYDFKAKKAEVTAAIEGGLKAELFSKIGEKGIAARITTEGEKITEILITGGKGKGKGGN